MSPIGGSPAAPEPARPSRQRGATAMEFALIFPLLFALLYGVVVYSYVFVLQESITYAAQQAAANAISVDPAVAGDAYVDTVRTRVRAGARAALDWLPEAQQERVLGSGGESVQVDLVSDPAGSLVEVRLLFGLAGMFPAVSLPYVGEIPPLPEALTATATVLVGESGS